MIKKREENRNLDSQKADTTRRKAMNEQKAGSLKRATGQIRKSQDRACMTLSDEKESWIKNMPQWVLGET